MRKPIFKGVFSERKSAGTRQAGKASRRYFFCWDLGGLQFAIQELDASFKPVKPPSRIDAADLANNFQYRQEILATPVITPDFRHLGAQARRATELNDNAMAELERARKARQVENDLRNSFEKAMRALGRPRDRKGALAAIGQIAETKNGIGPEHKHMFRDFGVSLRKKSLPELAARYAERVVQLAPNDDHAHFNLARLLGMLGRYSEAEKHIGQAMKLNRGEPVYGRLLAWLNEERKG